MIRGFAFLAGVVWLVGATPPTSAQRALQTCETRYYTLYSDLDEDAVREARLRITLMAEEYHARTRGLVGAVERRLPFYLFGSPTAYQDAGGAPGTAGSFDGHSLMAVADPKNPERTWRAVQHEGFHQFLMASAGAEIPIWANEGLAEYFGEGLFTGDQFLTGLIPPTRLARIRQHLAERRFKTLRDMMLTSHLQWNVEMTGVNYDQAWSMVHFLAHADDGKYREAFQAFLRDVSRGMEWRPAWERNFGRDIDAFERQWRSYWEALPAEPTAERYAEALVSTLTSFYARAFSQRQDFDTWAAFRAAAETGELQAHPEDWLPARLLNEALAKAPEVGEWSLDRRPGLRRVVCRTRGGVVLEGRFETRKGRVQSVTVRVRR